MVSQNVYKIFEEVQALTEAEREQLRSLLEARTFRLHEQNAVQKALVAEGLVSHVPLQRKDLDRFRRWQPVVIQGKPLSETIIEERR